MASIDGLGTAGLSRTGAARRRPAAGGAVFWADEAAGMEAASQGGEIGGMAALPGLLAMQEAADSPGSGPADGPERDAAAASHGSGMLDLMSTLQRAVLGGSGVDEALRRLSGMADAVPLASDPPLRSLMAAIRLRGQVELARRTRQGAGSV